MAPFQADVWLSPEVRLLADAPDVSHFVYDGNGHALVLPPSLHPADLVPLILVGAHRCALNPRACLGSAMITLGPRWPTACAWARRGLWWLLAAAPAGR